MSTGRFRARGAALVGVIMSVALLASCQQAAVNSSIDKSTAPLLVPTGEWRADFDFTAPPGAVDLYQFRWNFDVGSTETVTGWQVAQTTTYDQSAIAEGPGEAIVAEAIRAARGEECTIADRATGLQLCTYEAEFALGGVNAYLVRLEQNQVLVVDYSNLGGDRSTYNPASLEARFANADFELIPIDGEIDDYLVYIY